jgi:hypothetical protein
MLYATAAACFCEVKRPFFHSCMVIFIFSRKSASHFVFERIWVYFRGDLERGILLLCGDFSRNVPTNQKRPTSKSEEAHSFISMPSLTTSTDVTSTVITLSSLTIGAPPPLSPQAFRVQNERMTWAPARPRRVRGIRTDPPAAARKLLFD